MDSTQCLVHLEEILQHMEIRDYDRVPVIHFNRDYMLPALTQAGELYAIRLKDGFDMQY